MTATSNACKGRNKRGEPCAAPTQAGRPSWCYFHDPEKRQERAAARRAGGKARHGRTIGKSGGGGSVTLRTVGDCLDVLEAEAAELLSLERSVSRTRALVSLVSEAGRLIVNHEFEQRLEALEASTHGKQAS